MATLEKRGDSFRLIFYYRNERFTRSLKTDDKRTAQQLKGRLEGNLELLEQGRLSYEPGKDDLPTLLLTDGKLNARPEAARRMTLGEFFDDYEANLPPDKEKSTRYTEGIHIRHLRRIIGDKTPLVDVPEKLQPYVNARHAERTRQGEPVSQVTIKKELGSLTAIWNRWGIGKRHVTEQLTLRNAGYPKRKEKPPFQTWDQIARKTKGDSESELWDSVFLSVLETEKLLTHVQAGASIIRGHERHFPFVFPLFAFVAYTGCRRSEMLRAKVEDVDFERNELTIREKKKDRSKQETYRHIPLVPNLRSVLEDWLKIHPGGDVLFCRTAGEEITVQMASHHFR